MAHLILVPLLPFYGQHRATYISGNGTVNGNKECDSAYGAMLELLSLSGHSSCSKFENNMISKITDWREILSLWLMSHKVNKYYKQLKDLIVSDRHPTQMSSLKVISLSSRMPFEPQARQ